MARAAIQPTGRQVTFGENEVIVSKTDLKGHITYCNDVFLRISGYTEQELLGHPHSIIRHPGMPGCIFKLLWDTLRSGHELFAYVNNMTKTGDGYWVLAHVTPSFNGDGKVVGYHSNRRSPYSDALPKVQALYDRLLAEEAHHSNRTAAVQASYDLLMADLRSAGVTYDQYVFSLSTHTSLRST